MKNSPDYDQFNELERRLQNYAEEPDEVVWENIDNALRPDRSPKWLPWINRFVSAISVLAFSVMVNGISTNYPVLNSPTGTDKGPVILQPLENDAMRERQPSSERNVARKQPVASQERSFLKSTNSRDGFSELNDTENAAQSIEPAGTQTALSGADELMAVSTQNDSIIQDEKLISVEKRIRKRRIAFYANVTPSLAFQRAIPTGSDDIVVQEFSDVPILSSKRFGIGVDIGVQGFLAKRFEYYAGLSLYHQNQNLEYAYQSGSQVHLEPSGENRYTATPTSTLGSVNYEMLNLGVQAGILYNLYGKTLTHKLGAGVGYQHGFKKTGTESYDNSESSYFSYHLFYRNEVRLSPRLRVFIQPTFMQSVRVREKLDAPFNLKPYRAGIGFGILYDF